MAKRGGTKARSGGAGTSSRGPGRTFYLILAVVAAAGIGFLVLAGRGDGVSGLTAPLPAWAENVEADADAGIPLGPSDAPVSIMEFADHQCPHCAQFGTFTGRLLRQNYVRERGLVRWVMYDYLVGFKNSMSSAIAARCAGEQGRYWEMHDALLANQREWGESDSPAKHFRDYAEEAGLEMAAFEACLDERRPMEEVLASHQYGVELGVTGTPSLFLNGRKLSSPGETSYEGMERLILAAADSARGAAEEGASEEAPSGP